MPRAPRSQAPKFWSLAVSDGDKGAKHIDVHLYGVIDGGWLDDSVSTADIVKQLQANDDAKTIDVHINSIGGSAFGGIALYNALQSHKAEVTCIVEGIAASAASLVALAGKTVMGRGSVMMVHSPMVAVMGNAAELRKQANMLDKVQGSLTAIYTAKTGKSAEEVSQLLDDETWMTADEAVKSGFADTIADTDAADPEMAADAVVWSGVRFPSASLPSQVLAMARPTARKTHHVASLKKVGAPRAETKGKAMPDMDKLKQHAADLHSAAQEDYKDSGAMCEAMAPHLKAIHAEMGAQSPFHKDGDDDGDGDQDGAEAKAFVRELGGVKAARGVIAAANKTADRIAALEKEVAQAKSDKAAAEVKALLDEATIDGRIAPADRADMEKLHAEAGMVGLKACLSRLPKKPQAAREPAPAAAAATGSAPTAVAGQVALSPEEMKVAAKLGLKPEDFAAHKAKYNHALGVEKEATKSKEQE